MSCQGAAIFSRRRLTATKSPRDERSAAKFVIDAHADGTGASGPAGAPGGIAAGRGRHFGCATHQPKPALRRGSLEPAAAFRGSDVWLGPAISGSGYLWVASHHRIDEAIAGVGMVLPARLQHMAQQEKSSQRKPVAQILIRPAV